MPQTFIKDPSAILDYTIDWTDWLEADTISSSSWTIPAGLTKTSEATTTKKATAWLSGGTLGQFYTVTNRVVTAGGRTDERSIVIVVAQR